MANNNIYNVWKVKSTKVAKTFSPMIGVVYKGVDKFFGREVIGVLIEMFDQNDEAVLRTKDSKLISVDINSLKVVV